MARRHTSRWQLCQPKASLLIFAMAPEFYLVFGGPGIYVKSFVSCYFFAARDLRPTEAVLRSGRCAHFIHLFGLSLSAIKVTFCGAFGLVVNAFLLLISLDCLTGGREDGWPGPGPGRQGRVSAVHFRRMRF